LYLHVDRAGFNALECHCSNAFDHTTGPRTIPAIVVSDAGRLYKNNSGT
jgi:hypothetical protein